MGTVLIVVHVMNCLLLIVVVLLQSSKGGGLAGAFGGGGASQAVFGGRGAGTFLSRTTTVLAIIFMLTSLSLTVLGRRKVARASALQRVLQQEARTPVPTQGLAPRETPVEPLPAEGGGEAPAAPGGAAEKPAGGE